MFIIGLIMVFTIPNVYSKPTPKQSESIISLTNDTARAKRQPEFFDFLHHLIDKHANCADQQLAPVKQFVNYKPYETFIYPNGFPQPWKQSVGVSNYPNSTQVKMYPMQQQHFPLGSTYDPYTPNYISNNNKLKSINANQRMLPYNTNFYKKLPAYESNRYRLRNQQSKFRPQYRPLQSNERNRQMYNNGLQNQNRSIPINTTQDIEKENVVAATKTNIEPARDTEKGFNNILASNSFNTTRKPETQNCTCSNFTTPQPNTVETSNITSNLEHNLNLLIQELQSIINSTDLSTDNDEIFQILLKLKALKRSNANITTKALEFLTTTTESTTTLILNNETEDFHEIFTELTTLEPTVSTEESNIKETENIKALEKALVELQTSTLKTENFKPTTLNPNDSNTTENIQILNTFNISNFEDETDVKDLFIDLKSNLDDEVAITGPPALILNITNSNDLERIIHEIQNLVNDLQNKTAIENSKEDQLKLDVKSNDDNQNLKKNNGNFTRKPFKNITILSEILNKTASIPFQLSDKSSFKATTIKVPFKHNGKFTDIYVKQKSSKSSNKNIEISEKENIDLGNSNTSDRPIHMTGNVRRFLRKPKVPSYLSYAEPIVSEIYQNKANKWKSISPLSIYMHKIEEKYPNFNNTPSVKWKPPIPEDYDGNDDDYESDSSNMSKECKEYSEPGETKQKNYNLNPSFPELFDYGTNFT